MFPLTDPGLMSTIEEVFAALAANPGCHNDLHLRFLPVAMEALQSTENQLPLGLVAVSQCYRIHVRGIFIGQKFVLQNSKVPYPLGQKNFSTAEKFDVYSIYH